MIDISIFLFLALLFLLTFLLGRLLEKIRIPWIFASLILGLGLATYNPFVTITSSQEFSFLSSLGLYFLLFLIGFELDIKQIMSSSKFIVKTTFVLILAETFVGSIFVHYLFGTAWLIAILLAMSFATVGEAVLLPILQEFKMVDTKLGQTILGVAVFDDIFEIATVVAISIIIGKSAGNAQNIVFSNILVLLSLFVLVFLFLKFRSDFSNLRYKDVSSVFLISMFIIFFFLGVGNFVDAAALGALFAGVVLRSIIPEKSLTILGLELTSVTYGLFAPIFLLSVGLDVNVPYLIKYPLLVLGLTLLIKATKITSAYLVGRKELGTKKSIVMGVALSVKLSTSIVILKLLLDNNLISSEVFSVFIGTKILFKFIVPFVMSFLIRRWHLAGKFVKTKQSVLH